MNRKAIVAGPLAAKPGNAGGGWERLSWAVGLRRLGFDVLFVEECVGVPSATALDWFDTCARFFRFDRQAAIFDHGSDWSQGRSRDDLRQFAAASDLLVNLSGNLTVPQLVEAVGTTAYIDVDPGFTQIWHADPATPYAVPRHDHYFTIGENIGTSGCPIPTGGLPWKQTRQPLLLDLWPVAPSLGGPPSSRRRFTTIASWRCGFGPVAWEGTTFGLKLHEFRKVIELPERVAADFEIALDIHDGDARDREALSSHGWRLVPPAETVGTPQSFQKYIQDSAAEFSVAQGVYVHARSGWFSDRSTRYLSSGRPVLVQDTGLVTIPTGDGIVTFCTADEAVAGVEDILARYSRHAAAARDLAATHFDSDIVLGRLLGDLGLDAGSSGTEWH
jgi:hypothetical protein